jgi:uncharacterized coiled-coil protein SlyX
VAKLIKILAASVGSGIVLGAGIRLGEAIATWEPGRQPAQKFSERLGVLEDRLQRLEVGTSLDPEADLIHKHPATPLATAPGLRGELQEWLAESVAARMAEVETRLKTESERGQQQMLDVFVESVQTRVIHRISQLEDEVAGQSAAMNELRECSLRTERSIQKLLGGLDKLIAKPSPVQDAADDASSKQAPQMGANEAKQLVADRPPALPPEPSAQEAPQAQPRPRWHIFG